MPSLLALSAWEPSFDGNQHVGATAAVAALGLYPQCCLSCARQGFTWHSSRQASDILARCCPRARCGQQLPAQAMQLVRPGGTSCPTVARAVWHSAAATCHQMAARRASAQGVLAGRGQQRGCARAPRDTTTLHRGHQFWCRMRGRCKRRTPAEAQQHSPWRGALWLLLGCSELLAW